ncbi:MAG: GIY-YIG nuclease family protein [Planctomycetes bacterium]|nr:GIY-YIG nuclease family protein [Planctomycetota bacterium]
MNVWFVYALASDSLGATYVGISTDVARRLRQHNGESPGGARATRRGRPWRIVAVSDALANRALAMRSERAIKRHRGAARIAAIAAAAAAVKPNE